MTVQGKFGISKISSYTSFERSSTLSCKQVIVDVPLLRRNKQKEQYCQHPNKNLVQSNLSHTDTEGTERSVRIREVSMYLKEVTTMTSLLRFHLQL